MSLDQQLQIRIDAFIAELSALVRGQALEAVGQALGAPQKAAARPAAAKPAKAKSSNAKAPAAPKAAAPVTKRKKGQKRDPKELAALMALVKKHVGEHSGESIELIAKHLGRPSDDLKLPVAKLLAEKGIRKTGQKRGTRYFPVK